MFKRCLKLFLLVFAVFTVSFIMLSCGAKEKSKIYIIPESEFKSCVKVNDSGIIKRLNISNLEKADLAELITGEKYYAVMYVKDVRVTDGNLSFSNDSTVNTEKV